MRACLLNLTPAVLYLTFDLQWDAVEDKPTVLLYGGGAIVALWLTSVVVAAINAVPLVCSCSVRDTWLLLRATLTSGRPMDTDPSDGAVDARTSGPS